MKINLTKMFDRNSNIRAVGKTITWRVIATVITGITVYFYTGKVEETGKITLSVAIILSLAYYIHEKVWQSKR